VSARREVPVCVQMCVDVLWVVERVVRVHAGGCSFLLRSIYLSGVPLLIGRNRVECHVMFSRSKETLKCGCLRTCVARAEDAVLHRTLVNARQEYRCRALFGR
jgi:hypothetical protein